MKSLKPPMSFSSMSLYRGDSGVFPLSNHHHKKPRNAFTVRGLISHEGLKQIS
jgi:hypothetical protein